jgi:integrase
LEEVADMLDKLPESARTVCAVAAFTGLARSELKGLKWEDYDGETINGRRKIWNDHVGAPKTEAREAGVYVVPLLRKILAKYKASYPSVGEGWIFRGEKMLDHSIWTTCPGEIFLNTSTVRGSVGTPFAGVSARG